MFWMKMPVAYDVCCHVPTIAPVKECVIGSVPPVHCAVMPRIPGVDICCVAGVRVQPVGTPRPPPPWPHWTVVDAFPEPLALVAVTEYATCDCEAALAVQDWVVTPWQLPPLHDQLVAAPPPVQLDVKVIGVPTVPELGPAIEQLLGAPLPVMHVSVWLGAVPVSA